MMSKILKYGLLLPVAGLLLTACEEQTLNKFEASPSLWFYRGSSNIKGQAQRDSVNYSFFLAGSKTVDTVWLDVRLTGPLADYDRPLAIEQTNQDGVNAAVAGRDYEAFDSPDLAAKMVMPANSVSVAIPIVVKRTAQMNDTEYRLDLALGTNDYFVTGLVDMQTYTIKLTAMASQPANWNTTLNNGYTRAFGPWGQEKMRFLIDHIGYTDFDDTLSDIDLQYFYNLKARNAMTEYLLTHSPLKEADGTEVTFPRL